MGKQTLCCLEASHQVLVIVYGRLNWTKLVARRPRTHTQGGKSPRQHAWTSLNDTKMASFQQNKVRYCFLLRTWQYFYLLRAIVLTIPIQTLIFSSWPLLPNHHHLRPSHSRSLGACGVGGVFMFLKIDPFQYIKIQLKTIDLSMRLWGINPANSVVIPQSLVLRFIVLGWILIHRNWSIWSSFCLSSSIIRPLFVLAPQHSNVAVYAQVWWLFCKLHTVCHCFGFSRVGSTKDDGNKGWAGPEI